MSMKTIITSFNLDIKEYLHHLSDYGKPNCKYLNFVWNKMGFQYLFALKEHVFNSVYVAMEFVEEIIYNLKKMFLSEKSKIKRCGIIFILFKLYYADSTAKILKIRILLEEWEEFKSFIDELEAANESEEIRFMFWNLFLDDAFRFVVKNFPLGLDIYTNKIGNQDDVEKVTQMMMFWNDLRSSVNEIECSTIQDVKKLEVVHSKVTESMKDTLPNSNIVKEIIDDFEEIHKNVQSNQFVEIDSRSLKRKNKELKQYFADDKKSSKAAREEEYASTSDSDFMEASTSRTVRRVKKCKKPGPCKKQKKSESESEEMSEKEVAGRMSRKDYGRNCIMKAIGLTQDSKIDVEKINKFLE